MEQVILTGTIKLDAKAISPLRFGLLIADEYITCYNYVPFEVLEDQKTAVAEYLIRANHGVVLGNFEMNYGTANCITKQL